MNRIAIIDMGTNTFHLLIAERGEKGFTTLYRDYEATKIGMNGINEGVISEGACQRALMAMQRFKENIDHHHVAAVYAFGTSALRNARNRHELTEKIKSRTGIDVHVISGEEEADFIYEGVKAACDLGNEMNLIMDIGAGSVEFVIADQQQIHWKASFEIGGQRLLEKFQRHDPITPEEISALDASLEESLAPLLKACEKFQPAILIGSSGTFDTLSDIFCISTNIPRTYEEKETPLTKDGFYKIYREVIHKNREERMSIKGMIALRVDMIVVACCLIRFVLEKNNFMRIRVSAYALKEGVLSRLSRDGDI